MANAEENQIENRTTRRIPLHLLGVYRAEDGSEIVCAIRDISVDGARLVAIRLPQTGQSISLKIPALGSFEGKIVWVEDPQFGLSFQASNRDTATLSERLEDLGISQTRENKTALMPLQRADGTELMVELTKLSVDGADFWSDETPALGEAVSILGLEGKVFHVEDGRFAMRFNSQRQTSFDP